MARLPFRGRPDGTIDVALDDDERAMLAALPLQLRDLLATDDPSLRRLFPVAYHGDPAREAEYQQLIHQDLLARRIESAERLAAAAQSTRIEREEDVTGWLSAINDLRLVLGTQLDVSEDMDDLDLEIDDDEDPRLAQWAVYSWLGYLMEMLIRAAGDPVSTSTPSVFDQLAGLGDGDDPADDPADDSADGDEGPGGDDPTGRR